MSDADSDLGFEDDDANDAGQSGNAAKVLRKQNKDLNERNSELQKQLEGLLAKERQRSLADHLEQFNAPKRLAKYALHDIEGDVSEDAVKAWLDENGADFGWADDSTDEADDDTRRNAERIQATTRSAPQSNAGSPSDFLARLKTASAKDPEQLRALGII